MDLLTQLKLMWLGAWIVLAVLTLGTALGLSWLRDRREGCRSRLLDALLEQPGAPDVQARVIPLPGGQQ
jgi:hypothetical protein